jgi:glycosyltransferase involved in cell wall biosynthesis
MNNSQASVRLSIIIPCYNEEESICVFYEALRKVLEGLKQKAEIIFIDDGSTDNSLRLLRDLSSTYQNVHHIAFRKNMGKAAALQAGFRNCSGDIVITMDGDMQDDPEEIPRFIEKINEGYDVVSGWKFHRLDPVEKRLASKFFNQTVSLLSGIKLHDFNCGFKAYRGTVCQAINLYGELHRFIPVLLHRKGFTIAEIKVNHKKRKFGRSKYGIKRYLRGLFDAISVSFLNKYCNSPMYFFGKFGILLLLCGFGICVYLSILKICYGEGMTTRPLLFLGILLFISGLQVLSVGLIGEMIVDSRAGIGWTEDHIKENTKKVVKNVE